MTAEEIVYHQRIKLPYRYTAGAANTAFLDGLAAGVIRGSRCDACDLTLVPARPFCPRCSAAAGDVVDLPDRGVLVAHTVEASGRVVGLVRLDGADTHFPHVIGADPAAVANGTRVAARWSDDRSPEITAIVWFVPEAAGP